MTARPDAHSNGLRPGHYVALAGEFFVLGELARRRLDGTLTLGRTKEVDVLVLNRATGAMFRVEVKTSARLPSRSAIFGHCYTRLMDERHAHVSGPDLVYVFVLLNSRGSSTRFFIVPAPDVAAYIAWEYAHWRENSKRQTGKVAPMRVFRIPEGDSSCPVPPSSSDQRWRHWEDNWAIFGDREPAKSRRTSARGPGLMAKSKEPVRQRRESGGHFPSARPVS